jgi:phospholipase B1
MIVLLLLIGIASAFVPLPYYKYDRWFDFYVNENSKAWPKESFQLPDFVCNTSDIYPFISKTINNLTLHDIDITMAMGDSLTAAFGADATSLLNLFIDYRGVSWSGGGKNNIEETFTFPNILRQYNPEVIGFAIGSGDVKNPKSKLNTAITGATSSKLMKEAELIVERLRLIPDYNKKWKMLTIMIGANDLCDLESNPAELYYRNIMDVITFLRNNLECLYINLVAPPNVVDITELNSLWCWALHQYECPSAMSDPSLVNTRHQEYFQMLYEIEKNVSLMMYRDFALVVQPFLQDTTLPMKDGSPDLSYWSVDCFHFSQKAHMSASLALFDNLFELLGQKKDFWIPSEKLICPSVGQFIPT